MRGRIRTIKPEIHADEALWDLELQTGLPLFRLFVGLWAYADREGRFEWRPRALKAAILPYWEGDPSAALAALSGGGFIVGYTVGGRHFGVVRNFTKHQYINNREDQSVIPAPPENGTGTRAPPVPDACGTPTLHASARVGHAGKAEGKGTYSDPTGSSRETLACFSSSGAHTHTREVESSGFGLPDEPTAAAVQTRFRKLYLDRFGQEPYLGGKAVHDFPERLRGTAAAKGADALELLAQAFDRWASKPLEEIAQNAPYAAFAAKFGSLCEAKGQNGMSELTKLRHAQLDALEAGDRVRYESLIAEEKRRNNGKGD